MGSGTASKVPQSQARKKHLFSPIVTVFSLWSLVFGTDIFVLFFSFYLFYTLPQCWPVVFIFGFFFGVVLLDFFRSFPCFSLSLSSNDEGEGGAAGACSTNPDPSIFSAFG